MKHPVAPLSVNVFALTILLSYFQIKIGRWIELDFYLEVNTGANIKEEGSMGLSPPFKKTYDDQGEKYGI